MLYGVLVTLLLLVIIITYLAYKKIKPKPAEEADNVAIHHDMNRKLVSEIKKTLDDCLQRPDACNETFYREITLGATREKFENSYGKYLVPYTDDLKKLSHTDIEKRCNEMERHFHELLQLKREINLHMNRELIGK